MAFGTALLSHSLNWCSNSVEIYRPRLLDSVLNCPSDRGELKVKAKNKCLEVSSWQAHCLIQPRPNIKG